MQEQTGFLQTADGLTLHTYTWLPDDGIDIKGVVVVLHGMAEHAGRYRHVGEHLAGHGYAVYALDHRGHGRSGGPRTLITDFDLPVRDVEQFAQRSAAIHPGLPLFVFCHSMGTVIGLLYALRNQAALHGLVTSGTPLAMDLVLPALVTRLMRALARVSPSLRVLPLSAATLTHDHEVLKAHAADPLVDHQRMPVGILVGMTNGVQAVREQMHTLRLPLLILHGADDQLVTPQGSHLLAEKAASADKTLTLYPGMGHEIVNEVERERVLTDLSAWLDAHLVRA